MPRWLMEALARIRELAGQRKVRFTHKALRELATLDLGLDQDDCCDILEGLTVTDSAGRIRSVITGEWMYVFRPAVTGLRLYLKLIVRRDCIVISFHEEENENDS